MRLDSIDFLLHMNFQLTDSIGKRVIEIRCSSNYGIVCFDLLQEVLQFHHNQAVILDVFFHRSDNILNVIGSPQLVVYGVCNLGSLLNKAVHEVEILVEFLKLSHASLKFHKGILVQTGHLRNVHVLQLLIKFNLTIEHFQDAVHDAVETIHILREALVELLQMRLHRKDG